MRYGVVQGGDIRRHDWQKMSDMVRVGPAVNYPCDSQSSRMGHRKTHAMARNIGGNAVPGLFFYTNFYTRTPERG